MPLAGQAAPVPTARAGACGGMVGWAGDKTAPIRGIPKEERRHARESEQEWQRADGYKARPMRGRRRECTKGTQRVFKTEQDGREATWRGKVGYDYGNRTVLGRAPMLARRRRRGDFLELFDSERGIRIEKRGGYVEWTGMPERVEPRDDHLLRRMAAGDEEAFRLFYARHQGAIYRFALHMTGRREAAEEVVQDAFLTLIQKAGKFEPQRGEPQAFLYGIARMHVRRMLERERRYEPLDEEGNLEGAAAGGRNGHAAHHAREAALGELTRGETAEQVRRAVMALPQHYREVVTLCDLQGRDYAGAAKMLECPIGTVRSRLARARDMLAERLRPAWADAKKPVGGR